VTGQHSSASPPVASTSPTSTPSVGIFWLVLDTSRSPFLLVDLCPVGLGEPYGDFLTHGGHYDYWSKLAALGAGELRRRDLPTAPTWSEYEEWPRGRVVHHVPTRRFVLYADRQLKNTEALNLIASQFGLPNGRFDVRSDAHYVSARKVRLI
jgi:hypothetical protein